MRSFSLLSLCCFIAAAAAGLTELEELVLDAQCAADDAIPHMAAVEAVIQPFIDAAQALSDAANVQGQLAVTEGEIDNILGAVDSLEGVERAERREASGGIGDLQKVPKSLGRQYGVMRNKLEKAIVYVTELQAEFPGYRTTVEHGEECHDCGTAIEHCLTCSGGVCTRCASNTVLTDGVCEEVLTNLALNRPVSHDSDYGTCHVHYATDGHKSLIETGDCTQLQCQHTACHAGAHWLAIDLEAEREFSHVILLNREGSTSTRLHDVVVYTAASMPSLGDSLPAEVTRCGEYEGILDEAVFSTIQCDSVVTGRYVIIAMPNAPTCFTLCEVEIYNAPCYNLPALEHATTSYDKYECTGGYMFSSTNSPLSPGATCTLVNRGPDDEIAFEWTNIPAGICVP